MVVKIAFFMARSIIMGKKGLFYLILIYSLANSAFASDKVITNPNPIGGDILVADTCTHDMFEAVLFQALPTDYDGSWALVTSDSDLGY
ncbi:MAG: hypothetical protein GY855_12410, partial [candidate division Zixibacteria bacterium]|nr:hypothetical protein [candidate division Zixibacteria bacterium]